MCDDFIPILDRLPLLLLTQREVFLYWPNSNFFDAAFTMPFGLFLNDANEFHFFWFCPKYAV